MFESSYSAGWRVAWAFREWALVSLPTQIVEPVAITNFSKLRLPDRLGSRAQGPGVRLHAQRVRPIKADRNPL